MLPQASGLAQHQLSRKKEQLISIWNRKEIDMKTICTVQALQTLMMKRDHLMGERKANVLCNVNRQSLLKTLMRLEKTDSIQKAGGRSILLVCVRMSSAGY